MAFLGAIVGGSLGFAAQAYSNAIRKVPISRQPWKHAGMFILGCWAGNKYQKVEQRLVNDINSLREAKGLPPLVGSNAWIRYQTPESS